MRVTEKGQVTIPKNIRRHLGIAPGVEVEFELRDGEAIIRPVRAGDRMREQEVADFMTHIRSYKGSMNLGGMTPDEFISLLRD
jgi:AbrB family looped-hinge helix DNA binding protein